MKKALTVLAVLSAVFSVGAACNPFGKAVARTLIDAGLAACIAEHAEIEDEPALREICAWSDDLAPIVKDLLLARKKGAARMMSAKAASCQPDAGARDGGK